MSPPYTGDVTITIQDGGNGVVSVPSSLVQVVMGCANAGTNLQVFPAASPATLRSNFVGGSLLEAAGLTLLAGGVVLAVKLNADTAGSINTTYTGGAITGATNANPIVVTTTSSHGLVTGAVVTIASVGGNTAANGTWPVTVASPTTFSIPVAGSGAYTSGGTVTAKGSILGGSGTGSTFQGTAVPYISGTPNDDYYVMVVCQSAVTVGTGGTVLVSLDGGRSFGSPISVGTSTTLALKDVGGLDTGLTLNLGTSSMTWTGGGINSSGVPVGDFLRCSTVGPQANDSSVASGLSAILTYLSGSATAFPLAHVLGTWGASDATAFDSSGNPSMTTLASQFVYARLLANVRDAHAPTAWGGAGETEAAWLSSLNSAFSATTAKRVCMGAGHYNMPTAFPTQFAGAPIYRRPFSWALAARQVAIQPQTHAGRVGGTFGGALSQIVRNPVNDPTDGFVYHDEYLTPSLDYFMAGGVGRFATARTHPRKAGFFASNPQTLNAPGSDFALLPRAVVMDVACTLTYNAMIQFANADFVTRANGTLSDKDAGTIRNAISEALRNGMQNVGMISGFSVNVDQTQNIQVTNTIAATISILGKGYALSETVAIGYVSALAAQATG